MRDAKKVIITTSNIDRRIESPCGVFILGCVQMNDQRTSVAIIGSGTIGTDLMCKVIESEVLSLAFMVGRDANSKGLAIAKERHVATSSEGIDFLKQNADAFDIVFDATSAGAHAQNNRFFSAAGKFAIDL